MKTVIRMFKDYDKNIVFRDCQIFIWEERRSLPKSDIWSTVIGLLLRH